MLASASRPHHTTLLQQTYTWVRHVYHSNLLLELLTASGCSEV
jgi:hypothetical protein